MAILPFRGPDDDEMNTNNGKWSTFRIRPCSDWLLARSDLWACHTRLRDGENWREACYSSVPPHLQYVRNISPSQDPPQDPPLSSYPHSYLFLVPEPLPHKRIPTRKQVHISSNTPPVALELCFWLIPTFLSSAIFAGFLGFFLGPLFPAAIVVAAKLLPRRLHVSAIGFAAAVGGGGAAIFPFAVGAIANSRGLQVLQPFALALLVAILLLWCVLPGGFSKEGLDEVQRAREEGRETREEEDLGRVGKGLVRLRRRMGIA